RRKRPALQRICRHIWSFSDHLGLFAAASGCHTLRGRRIHHRRLLVHFFHVVCKPGRNARTGRKRYVRRDSSRGCARLYRRADRRGRGRDCAISMARPGASYKPTRGRGLTYREPRARESISEMNRVFLFPIIFTILLLTGFGQDPTKVAPDAYKIEFENEWVKVTRVHYAPHAKIAAQDHTETGAAYVYLNDSGPVIFEHINLSYGAITRPETKTGSFRLYKAVKESHEVENPNDTPSDFLRVEFKTDADATTPLRGKFHREAYSPGENFEKVQFENAQIRVTRLACAKTCDLPAAADPALLVVLSPMRLKSSGSGE